MKTERVVGYVMDTPLNTNKALLTAMLDELGDVGTEPTQDFIQLRRATEGNYDAVGDIFVPAHGEICLVDTVHNGLRIKCGDGFTVWNELSYLDDYIVKGYYYDGMFYLNAERTHAIVGMVHKLYVDKTTNAIYHYKNEGYVPVRVEGLAKAAYKNVVDILSGSEDLPTDKAVKEYIDTKIQVLKSFDVIVAEPNAIGQPKLNPTEETMFKYYLVPRSDDFVGYNQWVTIRSGEPGEYVYEWVDIGFTETNFDGLVPSERTIADIALDKDITADDLKGALELKALAHKDNAKAVLNLITEVGSVAYTPTGTIETTLEGEEFTVVTDVGTAAKYSEGKFTAATLEYEDTDYATEGLTISFEGEKMVFSSAKTAKGSLVKKFSGGSKEADSFTTNTLPTTTAHKVGVSSTFKGDRKSTRLNSSH